MHNNTNFEKSVLFTKNLSLLAKKNPALAALVESSTQQDSCYGSPLTAKDGSCVAAFTDKTALFSLYNPDRDIQRFVETLEIQAQTFCLICGLGFAGHIMSIMRNCKQTRILAVEKNAASIATLFNHRDFTALLEHADFFLTVPEQLFNSLCMLYLPALFPHFKTVFLRPWVLHNNDEAEQIRAVTTAALKKIAADYSVQAHFGKIWMRNILQNLRMAAKLSDRTITFPTKKTAHIIAAGPSLDETLPELAQSRDDAYIIATDTALSVLNAYGIIPDAVVSIDGQNISYLHFFYALHKKTLLVVDLCAHPAAAKCALKSGCPIIFAQSAHPLCTSAAEFQTHITGKSPFLPLDVSSGTVAAAAADFAVHVGFKHIVLHGADFAYRKGKPYARGTYLDVVYGSSAHRLDTAENRFTALMYRTRVYASGDGFATEILQQYAQAFSALACCAAKENGATISRQKECGTPFLSVKVKKTQKNTKISAKNNIIQYSYLFSDFICRLIEYTEKKQNTTGEIPVFLLPFAAWLRKKNIPQDVFVLAKSMMERYNK